MKIPFARPQIDHKEIKNVYQTLKTGIFVLGSKTTRFRKSYIISLEVKIVLYLPQHLVQRQCTFFTLQKK